MIPAHRQRNYLQSALYVIIAGICAAVLLERVLAYAEAAERYAMDATLSRLHSALYTRLAYHAMRQDRAEIEELTVRSPFRSSAAVASSFLGEAGTPNYLGEFEGIPSGAASGNWLFDRSRGELVYLPRLSRFLEGVGGQPAPAALRFKVQIIEPSTGTYTGVRLQTVELFRWDVAP